MKYRIRHLSSEELQWTKEKYPQAGAQAYAIFDSDVLTLDGAKVIIAYYATREEAEDARRRYYRIFRLFKQWLKDTTPQFFNEEYVIKEENVASLVRHVISCQTEEGEEINLDYWFKRYGVLSMEPQAVQERRVTMVGGKHSIIKQFSFKELPGPRGSYYGIISGGGAKVMSCMTEEQAQYFLRQLERISCLFEQWAKDTAIALDSSIDEVAKVVRGLKV